MNHFTVLEQKKKKKKSGPAIVARLGLPDLAKLAFVFAVFSHSLFSSCKSSDLDSRDLAQVFLK